MNEDRLNELLERCDSPIERELLLNLYPHLTTDCAQELRAQYMIESSGDMLTISDFAFPDMRIVIYCDGYAPREGNREAFKRDRLQSRELQLEGWIVLRFAGSEINYDSEMVVETIQRSIARRDRQRAWRSQQQQEHQPPKVAIPEPPPEPQERPVKQTRQPRPDHQRPQKPQSQQKTEGGGRNQQPAKAAVTTETRGWNVRCCFPRLCDCRNACIAGFYFLKATRQAHLPTPPLWLNFKPDIPLLTGDNYALAKQIWLILTHKTPKQGNAKKCSKPAWLLPLPY